MRHPRFALVTRYKTWALPISFFGRRPADGAIQALVGGFDFYANKFNRATQAKRQAGSGLKPFLYAAGLAQGLTPASVFLDAPVVVDDPSADTAWRPQNFDGEIGRALCRERVDQYV